MRVVHIAPGPTDLDDVCVGLDQVPHALGRHDVARDDRHGRVECPDGGDRADHGFLVAVRGVHDEGVDTCVEELLGLARHITVDADGRRDPQLAVRVRRGGVQRRPQCGLTGEDADEAAVRVDRRGELAVGAVELVEGLPRVDVRVEHHEVLGHDLGQLGEAVHAGQVVVGDDPDRTALGVHDDAGPVSPLVQEGERVGDGLAGGQHDRRVEHEVALLDPADDLGDDLDRDVLGDHDEAAAAGDGFGHPAARDGGHVRHDERDGGAAAVRRGEIHGLPGPDRGTAGDHEDIVVREVVGDRGRGRVATGSGLKKTHKNHFFIRNGAGRFHEDTAMSPRVRQFLQGGCPGAGQVEPALPMDPTRTRFARS